MSCVIQEGIDNIDIKNVELRQNTVQSVSKILNDCYFSNSNKTLIDDVTGTYKQKAEYNNDNSGP